jgi:hypothetical protein
MAWTKVQEQGHLATSKTTLDEKTATRVFIAISDAPTTTVAAETASDGTVTIPVGGASHPGDSSRKVKGITAKPADESNRTIFVIEVEYSDKLTDNQLQPNPLARADDISWDFDDAKEPYFIDRSTTPKACVNSAGDRFSEFLERETGSLTATVIRNVPLSGTGAYDPATAVEYKDAVNSDSITIDGATVAAGKCKMKAYTCSGKQRENGHDFRQVKFVLQFRASWDDVVEDRGFNEFFAPLVAPKPIVDQAAVPVTSPYPLDGSGAKKTNPTDTPATLTFVPYTKLTFAGFSFT